MNLVVIRNKTSQSNLKEWLDHSAVPLWRTHGIDHQTMTAWEALDHAAEPLSKMNRRLRVQARQAYCFAQVGETELAHSLFRFAMTKGVDPKTGNLASLFSASLHVLDAPHDLYDLSFMLLAAAALIQADKDVSTDLARLEEGLERLKATRGWFENAARTGPRRQNPHMHLFEAATALYAATREERFKQIAKECLGLFRDVFLQPSFLVHEYFRGNWDSIALKRQRVEPGHMAEWVHLLARYERVTGESCGVDLIALFTAAWRLRDARNFLPDEHGTALGTRRLWPQTELLKAACALRDKVAYIDPEARPNRIAARLWAEYLDPPCIGGWYDQRDYRGKLVSDTMPSSSFYHVLSAVNAYCGLPIV